MFFGRNWDIDGVTAGVIAKIYPEGRYVVTFEACNATLDEIERINWAEPSIEPLSDRCAHERGLPRNCGFQVLGIEENESLHTYSVTVQAIEPGTEAETEDTGENVFESDTGESIEKNVSE